jgi:hypothetical protein
MIVLPQKQKKKNFLTLPIGPETGMSTKSEREREVLHED